MVSKGAGWSAWTGDADDFGARVVPVFPRFGDGFGGVVAWTI